MGSLLHCLFRVCCEEDEDESERHVTTEPGSVSSRLMSRSLSSSRLRHGGRGTEGYQIAPQDVDSGLRHDSSDDHDVERQEVSMSCCRPTSSRRQQARHGGRNRARDSGIHGFLRKLKERWRKYDNLEGNRDSEDPTDTTALSLSDPGYSMGRINSACSPSLRTASSFDASRDILTIGAEEIVLPGSDLQKEMAQVMSEKKLTDQGDECVICMEGFDPTNPRMPTLCGCGENKTYFHLPCLYQWIEQSQDCPSCRKRLRWEEF